MRMSALIFSRTLMGKKKVCRIAKYGCLSSFLCASNNGVCVGEKRLDWGENLKIEDSI